MIRWIFMWEKFSHCFLLIISIFSLGCSYNLNKEDEDVSLIIYYYSLLLLFINVWARSQFLTYHMYTVAILSLVLNLCPVCDINVGCNTLMCCIILMSCILCVFYQDDVDSHESDYETPKRKRDRKRAPPKKKQAKEYAVSLEIMYRYLMLSILER